MNSGRWNLPQNFQVRKNWSETSQTTENIILLQNNSSEVNNYDKEMQIHESFQNIVKFYGNLHFHNYLQKIYDNIKLWS